MLPVYVNGITATPAQSATRHWFSERLAGEQMPVDRFTAALATRNAVMYAPNDF